MPSRVESLALVHEIQTAVFEGKMTGNGNPLDLVVKAMVLADFPMKSIH